MMTFLKWLCLAIVSIIGTIVSYFLTPILCLFLDKDGNLKYGRSLFQPSDNPAIGDMLWVNEHPAYGNYRLAVSYCWRNPAQGLDKMLGANVTMQTQCKVWWRKNDNYLYTGGGYFHLSYRLGVACGGLGWRLNNIVEGYPHPTMGQIVTTLIRFHR